MWSRREFLAAAGAGFAASLLPAEGAALELADAVFATSIQKQDGTYAAALVTDRGALVRVIDLPARGHDVTQCPVTGRIVTFARRPGTFALVFDPHASDHQIFSSPAGRHFYGHGIFSPDGKLLYATENDFNNVRGKIGIYDATDGFKRLGEWASGGVGPHDMLLSSDGRYLCVANGGIETHPDMGRAKLNLATMQPNLCWIERTSGHLIARHDLPGELHQLSTRHLATGPNGSIWFACQYQGQVSDPVPLLGRIAVDEDIAWTEFAEGARSSLRNYVGSIASSPDGNEVALGSPVGNALVVVNAAGEVVRRRALLDVCGVAHRRGAFSFSSGRGLFGTEATEPAQHDYGFDHHLLTLSPQPPAG